MSDDKVRPVEEIIDEVEKLTKKTEELEDEDDEDDEDDDIEDCERFDGWDRKFLYDEVYREQLLSLLYTYKKARNDVLNRVSTMVRLGLKEYLEKDELLKDISKAYPSFKNVVFDYADYLTGCYEDDVDEDEE